MVKLTENLVLARSRASDLENVRKLNCWGTRLTDISIIQQLTNVQVVSLSVNQIATLSDFAACLQLEELYIRKNCIAALREVVHLRRLPRLRILWLADNPCAAADAYRATVLRTLPNLQKLDNVAVQPDEINDAIEKGIDLYLSDGGATEGADVANVIGDGITVIRTAETPETEPEPGEITEAETPISLTWEETNKIREQLGLRRLPVEKATPMKLRTSHGAKQRNANIVQAVLALIKELDADNLQIIADAIHNKLDLA